MAIALIIIDSMMYFICPSLILGDILTSLKEAMPMAVNSVFITTHAVIAGIAASLLLPQEY